LVRHGVHTGCGGAAAFGAAADFAAVGVLGALATIEMALDLAGIPHGKGGVQAAADYLISEG